MLQEWRCSKIEERFNYWFRSFWPVFLLSFNAIYIGLKVRFNFRFVSSCIDSAVHKLVSCVDRLQSKIAAHLIEGLFGELLVEQGKRIVVINLDLSRLR